jgi:hypothetical protein
MKRTCMLLAASLMLGAPMFAQKPMDDANEKAVRITQGPNITNISANSATINWTTNSSGANHVRYRVAGSNSAWKNAYHSGGGTGHSLQLTGLEPGKTYEWQILTRDGDLRTAGQFQTPASGTAPDVNASSTTPAPAVPAAVPPSTGGATASGTRVPLYREVSTTNGNHLYTTNAGEQQGSFRMEGATGYVMASQTAGTAPLYRLSNAAGDYLLTTDANEKASAMAGGYSDQGTLGYLASSQQPGTEPLYKVASPDGKSHFYTTNSGERDQIVGRGWKDQGIAGYIWTTQQ